MTFILALLFWGTVFLSSCGSVLATDGIGEAKIDPTSPIYFLKTIRESLELKLALNRNIKVLRYLEFAGRRIREVNSLVGKNSPYLIPPTLERYWVNFNHLNELLDIRDEKAVAIIIQEISLHLNSLVFSYGHLSNPRAKMAIRAAINRLSIENKMLLEKLADMNNSKMDPIIDKLYLSQTLACDFLNKEASQSGLNDTEKEVLIDRAASCFQSLNLGRF